MKTSRRDLIRNLGLIVAGVSLGGTRTFAAGAPATGFSAQAAAGADEISGVIRLSSNENPYGPSPLALKAMEENVRISNRYQWQTIRDLMAAIGREHDMKPENVLLGAGSNMVIDTVLRYAALSKGNVVVADPTFSHWTAVGEKIGLQKVMVPLTPGKQNDLSAMLKAINADTRMVYLCNPNNPTGTICRYEDIVSFVQEVTKRTLVLLDEAYLDYTTQPSLKNIAAENKNLVVVKTFSKIYGLAGARIGYALGHTETIEKISDLQAAANVGISAASMGAALASLGDKDFVKDTFAKNEKARAYTIAQMEKLHIRCIPSHTNFIYFSLSGYKDDFFARLKAHNIEGTGIFEEEGKWSRITVGTLQEMQQLIAAIS